MFLKKAQLLSHSEGQKVKGIYESLQKFSRIERGSKVSIFVSHKHDENEYLEALISLLNKFGVDLYFDWLDEGMPKTTSGATATRIKEKIKENEKFILLATEGAIESKWCNWELGFGDAHKYLNSIAIFPVEDYSRTFSGNEYLQIYPYIEYVEENTVKRAIGGYFDKGYYVINPPDADGSRTLIKLFEWLKRRSS